MLLMQNLYINPDKILKLADRVYLGLSEEEINEIEEIIGDRITPWDFSATAQQPT